MAVPLAKVLWWTSSHFRVMVPQKEYGYGAFPRVLWGHDFLFQLSHPEKKPSENPKIFSTY